MTSAEYLKILSAHFGSAGWPLHVDFDKLQNRGRIVHDPSISNMAIIEIERHRPILGDAYVPGLPMSNFETYCMRYGIDLISHEVTQLAEKHICFQFDVGEIVDRHLSGEFLSINVEAVEDDRYRICDGVSRNFKICASEEEAKEFALELCESFEDFFYDELSRFEMPQSNEQEFKTNFRNAYVNQLERQMIEMIEEVWARRDEDN